MSEFVRLRLRVGYVPRDAEPLRKSARAPRHAELVHVHADDEGRPLRAVRVSLVDGEADGVMVAAPADGDDTAFAWADRQRLEVGSGASTTPAVVSLDQLGSGVLRAGWQKGHVLLTFHPSDLGCLYADVRATRGGGFSVDLRGGGAPSKKEPGKWADSGFKPRLRFDGPFVHWQTPPPGFGPQKGRCGPIVPLALIGEALGADASSPAALCAAYGIRWPDEADALDQLLAEGLALVEVYRRMVADLVEVAPGLALDEVFSAGSLITLALRRAGAREAAETCATLPLSAIGACASAFIGGRVEALLVGLGMPMAMADLNGTYPAMFSLLGLTKHLACDHFEVATVPVGVVGRHFDPGRTREKLGNRAWWSAIGSLFVQVEPHGEVLPCVREAEGRWHDVNAPLDLSGGRLWYHAADLVRPALAGRLPKVVKAFRVVPVGTAAGVRPVRLPSGATCNLTCEDWGQALVREREMARAIEDPSTRARRESLAKLAGLAGAWGIFGRVDPSRLKPTEAVGPAGEPLGKLGERPGPFTLWHIASAITAACRAILATAQFDIEASGGSVAAVLTDCLVVPAANRERLVACAGGPHRLADGSCAVKLLSLPKLRAILNRFDALLYPDGARAWKGEEGSLDNETWGLVAGTNKVLLGRYEQHRFRLLRSSDTALGDHYLDPTGTGDHLDDGRLAWSAGLEERMLAELAGAGGGTPVVPKALPRWADDRPLMRARRAQIWEELRWLRGQLGDPDVPPLARYVQVEGGPLCLGTGRDPATWRDWQWRRDGKRAAVFILGTDGEGVAQATTAGACVAYLGTTAREQLEQWLRERDPTVSRRGLRRPQWVQSHSGRVELVGRSHVAYSGVEDAPAYSVGGAPSDGRRCEWCGAPLPPRRRRWCNGDACRKRAARAGIVRG